MKVSWAGDISTAGSLTSVIAYHKRSGDVHLIVIAPVSESRTRPITKKLVRSLQPSKHKDIPSMAGYAQAGLS